MKLFHLVLWQLMVVVVVARHHVFRNTSNVQSSNESRYKREIKITTLTLKVKINGRSQVINLVSTNQLLANEHLPVWISSPTSSAGFRRLPDIMSDGVGPFTMYHDYATSSAVVYFHKRRELDGIIGMMYKIEGIPVDELEEEIEIKTGLVRSLNLWKYFTQSPSGRGNCRPRKIHANEESRLKVYPELLIAVSHDMVQAIESKSKDAMCVRTISHVITVYNAVDMLFKFVQSADISVNIAAIVIETSHNEWGLLSQTLNIPHINANKINDRVRAFFQTTENIFRRHSYDYIAYHTRRKLMDKVIPIHGVADSTELKPSFLPSSKGYRHNIAIVDHESYEHYSTIAHELSHIFGVEHDRIFNWVFQSPSERSIMAAFGIPSLSLKWSQTTEKELAKFLASPAHCILKNYPSSLLLVQPRIVFTAEEQCQCYGYESAKQALMGKNLCLWGFTCLDKDGKSPTEIPLPMDGTPCNTDSDMVCWAEKCIEVGNYVELEDRWSGQNQVPFIQMV